MIIDQKLLDDLSAQAKANPRLRQSYDLRTTPKGQSQRMLNALEIGTILPIHCHKTSTETLVMVRGKLCEDFYNDKNEIIESIILEAGGEVPMIQIPVGQWHSLEVLDEGTIIFEAKDGAYEPLLQDDVLTK